MKTLYITLLKEILNDQFKLNTKPQMKYGIT